MKKNIFRNATVLGVLGVLFILANEGRAEPRNRVRGNLFLSQYIERQTPFALTKVMEAFIGADSILNNSPNLMPDFPGAIVAAPSTVEDVERGEVQDYRWRWKRDSALVMRALVRMMIEGELSGLEESKKVAFIRAYVDFCTREHIVHRKEDGEYDLAHAKVTLSGERNPHRWGYPQSDGPPLEIYTLVDAIKLLDQLKLTDRLLMQDILQLIGRNSDYILSHYLDPSVERWEEAKADSHFSIWLEMRGALGSVQELSTRLSPKFRRYLGGKFAQIPATIDHLTELIRSNHLSDDGSILSHVNLHRDNSLAYDKDLALDTQVLMSAIATNKYWENPDDLFLPPSHPAMRATFQKLREAFSHKYLVNRTAVDPSTGEHLRGVVFGRYPEDHGHFRASPSFITSFTAVQFLLWDSLYVSDKGVIQIEQNDFSYFLALDVAKDELMRRKQLGAWPIVINKTDPSFLALRDGLVRLAKESFYRIAIHAGEDGLTEIFDGETGFKGGIQHLTWSYVEFLKTVRLMRRAQSDFGIGLDLDFTDESCDLILQKSS